MDGRGSSYGKVGLAGGTKIPGMYESISGVGSDGGDWVGRGEQTPPEWNGRLRKDNTRESRARVTEFRVETVRGGEEKETPQSTGQLQHKMGVLKRVAPPSMELRSQRPRRAARREEGGGRGATKTLLPIKRQTPSTPGWSEAQSPSTALQVLEAPLV